MVEISNSHITQGDGYMAKGRKTTYEERAEIAAFCVTNNDNYWMTSEQFQVSYQQVYTWVKNYKQHGYEALIDRRGKRKNPEELSETERSAAQFKLLEAENKRLKMENDFSRKLAEVERRRLTGGRAGMIWVTKALSPMSLANRIITGLSLKHLI